MSELRTGHQLNGVRLTEGQFLKLTTLAFVRDCKPQEVIRQLLDEYSEPHVDRLMELRREWQDRPPAEVVELRQPDYSGLCEHGMTHPHSYPDIQPGEVTGAWRESCPGPQPPADSLAKESS